MVTFSRPSGSFLSNWGQAAMTFTHRGLAFLIFMSPLFHFPYAHAVTFNSIQKTIVDQKLNSLENLLPLLPEALRSHFALIFQSRSLQGATPINPRVLLYDEGSSFVMTFNGDHGQKGFETLEMMEFDETSQEFVFHEIEFPSAGKTPAAPIFSSANPEKCQKCHGQSSLRPIWDTHPFWPGTYGEVYHAPLSIQEVDGIRQFLAIQATHPRYKYLLKSEIFSNKETFNPSTKNRYDGVVQESPAEELSRLLSRLNERRILKKVRQSPLFESFKYALLASLTEECGSLEYFIPEGLRVDFIKKYKEFSQTADALNQEQEKLKQWRAVSKLAKNEQLSGPRELGSDVVSLNSFRFLAEYGLALSTIDWTTAMEVRTYDFTAPQSVTEELESQLLRSVAQAEPDLLKYYALQKVSSSEKYCSTLRRESLQALRSFTPAPQQKVVRKGVPTLRPESLKTCTECHQNPDAPWIPFDQPEKLAKLLNQGGYPRGTLFEEIFYRFSPGSGKDRMPQGLNLSQDEIQELEDYFRQLRTFSIPSTAGPGSSGPGSSGPGSSGPTTLSPGNSGGSLRSASAGSGNSALSDSSHKAHE